MRIGVLAAVAAVGIAMPPAAFAQWTPPSPDSIRTLIEARVERGLSAGLVVGWLDQGHRRTVAAGSGPGSRPLDEHSVFEIGSVSKVLTTLTLAVLAERGAVRLDDGIDRYLPDSVRAPAWPDRPITLLDLATASSGLPRLPALESVNVANPYATYGATDLYRFLSSHTLAREPGTQYEYSNLGMGLLGHLLARHAGTSYEDVVLDRLLRPLGMSDTRIELTADQAGRLAPGHGLDLARVASWDFEVLAGAGAWRSTVPDLLRLADAMLHPPDGPLGRAVRLASVPRRPAGAPDLSIGLGWHILDRGGRRILWHNGGTGGYASFIAVVPSDGASVVVLSNSAISVDDLGFHIVDPTFPLRELPPPEARVDVATLERYAGRYETVPGFAIEVSCEDGALIAQATGRPPYRLRAASATRFLLPGVEAEIRFTAGAAGAITGLVLVQGGQQTPGRRVR